MRPPWAPWACLGGLLPPWHCLIAPLCRSLHTQETPEKPLNGHLHKKKQTVNTASGHRSVPRPLSGQGCPSNRDRAAAHTGPEGCLGPRLSPCVSQAVELHSSAVVMAVTRTLLSALLPPRRGLTGLSQAFHASLVACVFMVPLLPHDCDLPRPKLSQMASVQAPFSNSSCSRNPRLSRPRPEWSL